MATHIPYDHEQFEVQGEIVTWQTPASAMFPFTAIKNALAVAGLDEAEARDLLPRNAFQRAVRHLSENRIVKRINDGDDDWLSFQFTRETLENNRYSYRFQAIVSVGVSDGEVRCENDDLRKLAQTHIDSALKHRSGSDISRIVKRMFRKHADLFCLNSSIGGAYFVPAAHREFVDKIETFMQGVGGRVLRYPVPKGLKIGDDSVKQVVADGLREMVDELRTVVASWGETTRDVSFEHMAARFKTVRHKVDSYAQYLDDMKAELVAELSKAQNDMRKRVEQLVDARPPADPKRRRRSRRKSDDSKQRSERAERQAELTASESERER